jgi:hypothetical protein
MKRLLVALSAFALLATSCSAGVSELSEPSTPSPSPRASPAEKPPAHVGDTINLKRIGNGTVAVTLVGVINPAKVADGSGEAGKNYIATKLTIKNTGTSTIVGDANNHVAVTGSDNQIYPASYASVAGCKNFLYGEFILPAGDSTTDCVAFALPPDVKPVRVKYTPPAGIAKDVGEWLNP